MILPNVSARRQSATMTPKLAEVHELLRHELSLSPSGAAKLTWPLFFRPMHDALIEESLDRAEREFGSDARLGDSLVRQRVRPVCS